MRIISLSLKNIGPFIEADLDFTTEVGDIPRVVLITGENGTGKSIVLDAIRGMFGPQYAKLERDIRRKSRAQHANVEIALDVEQESVSLSSNKILDDKFKVNHRLASIPNSVVNGGDCPNWVVDFWASPLANGSYKVETLKSPQHREFLRNALQGTKTKSDITQLICHFDYMRDSRDAQERATGEQLYAMLERIIANSLLNGGKLSHVARATYDPIIVQNEQPVSLTNLSAGNLYLIQNMVGLLGKMYSVHFLRETPLTELGQTPGLLLIDEAENQLHPKWQKRFIRAIFDVFPNLQIIATTHSPFIISSVSDARLFVCKSKGDHCIIVDETAQYSNKPVDEILMSPLFEETLPFNVEITRLIEQRKQAVEAGDEEERAGIESKLKELNPAYFSYFEVEELLAEITQGGSSS